MRKIITDKIRTFGSRYYVVICNESIKQFSDDTVHKNLVLKLIIADCYW